MKKLWNKVKEWYSNQSDTTKAFIWVGLICIIGIIVRWDAIVAGVTKGFKFYSAGQ